jgi:hypothetical protein
MDHYSDRFDGWLLLCINWEFFIIIYLTSNQNLQLLYKLMC